MHRSRRLFFMANRLLISILAAGASRRLGQPKQLVKIAGETLIHRQSRIALESKCGDVVVILGAASAECASAIADLTVSTRINDEWEEGMAASIREATRAAVAMNADGLMIVQVDQYRLTTSDLVHLASIWRASEGAKSCRTRSGEYAGPPVILHKSSLGDALRLAGDEGARIILRKLAPEQVIDVDLPNAIADLDIPADLEFVNLAALSFENESVTK
jgi:molybdenum cofactor cytidylyltransferase